MQSGIGVKTLERIPPHRLFEEDGYFVDVLLVCSLDHLQATLGDHASVPLSRFGTVSRRALQCLLMICLRERVQMCNDQQILFFACANASIESSFFLHNIPHFKPT